jgi:meiotic recombination protein DMC1
MCFVNYHSQGSSFATGVDIQEKRKRVLIISTGSKSVDAVLGGRILSHVDVLAH